MNRKQPWLHPADVVVSLALIARPALPYVELSARLHMSVGAVHGAVKRLQAALLLIPGTRLPNKPNLKEFLLFGVQYSFYPVFGGVTRGVPTAYSAPPLRDELVADDALVWPSAEGELRGQSLVPLYPGAPLLVNEDTELYHALTVIDTLRIGQSRERDRARDWLASYVGFDGRP